MNVQKSGEYDRATASREQDFVKSRTMARINHISGNPTLRECSRTHPPHRGTPFAGEVLARIAAITLLGGVSGGACGQTLTVLPVADTSIFFRVQSPFELLSNGRGSIFTGRTALTHDIVQRGLIRFDVSAIPCGSIITGVELRVTLLRAGGGGGRSSPVLLHRLTESWGEGNSSTYGGNGAPSVAPDANWTERFHPGVLWTTPGGEFESLPSASAAIGEERSVVWLSTPELIADVDRWVRDGAGNHGWLLLGDESVSASARKLASREYPDIADRPTLWISYTARCAADLPIGGTCPDGTVDGSDFIGFVASFVSGDPTIDGAADINSDGIIDGGDFVAFINAFGAGC